MSIVDNYAGQRVFPIAYHVDYWDYLGWPDPFADAAYTARQERYAMTMGLSSMYTPQSLVNFTETSQFSVSDNSQYADYYLEQEVNVSATVWLESAADVSPLVVNYMVDGAPESGVELTVVLVETALSTVVTSGENNGLTLDHANVARGMTTVTGDLTQGQLEITPAEGVDTANASLIAFVQDTADLDFMGATSTPLVAAE